MKIGDFQKKSIKNMIGIITISIGIGENMIKTKEGRQRSLKEEGTKGIFKEIGITIMKMTKITNTNKKEMSIIGRKPILITNRIIKNIIRSEITMEEKIRISKGIDREEERLKSFKTKLIMLRSQKQLRSRVKM